ncbi:MAG: hypothetical protein IKY79_01475 [Bacteroidales bacterium]|nr:hypothetical protein [Bacteroidales bacterium]
MKRKIEILLFFILGFVVISISSCSSQSEEYDEILVEARNFKNTLSNNYTILAEVIDSAVAKIYYSSYLTQRTIYSSDCDIHVYDIHTKVSKVVDFEIAPMEGDLSGGLGHGIMSCCYYNGKVFFDIYCGSSLTAFPVIKYIDIYTDKIIDFSGGCIDKLENGILYTKEQMSYYDDKKNVNNERERYIDLGVAEFSYNL